MLLLPLPVALDFYEYTSKFFEYLTYMDDVTFFSTMKLAFGNVIRPYFLPGTLS